MMGPVITCNIRDCRVPAAIGYTRSDGSGAIALCDAHAQTFRSYLEQPNVKAETNNIDLRDWFAGMAMRASLARSEGQLYTSIAEACYRMADAMLVERAKSEEAK